MKILIWTSKHCQSFRLLSLLFAGSNLIILDLALLPPLLTPTCPHHFAQDLHQATFQETDAIHKLATFSALLPVLHKALLQLPFLPSRATFLLSRATFLLMPGPDEHRGRFMTQVVIVLQGFKAQQEAFKRLWFERG